MIRLLKRPRVVVAALLMLSVIVVLCINYYRFSRDFPAFSSLLEAKLRTAACKGDIRRVNLFLDFGVDVNATGSDGHSALIDAETCKLHDEPTRVQLVKLLIAKGAAVNLRTSDDRSAVMYAARNGDAQAVNALLTNGASVNLADTDGETALMKAAASSCNEETVRELIRAGADLNARDRKGQNALDAFRSSYACPDNKLGDLLKAAGSGN